MHPSAENINALYERHASSFDQDRAKVLIEQSWLDRFLAAKGAGDQILDVGCGSGDPIARYLIGAGCALTGVDASPSLIALCTQRFPTHRWHVEDMRALDLGVRYAGILAWCSFFHLPPVDQRAMFPIFRAHAAPGAALIFASSDRERAAPQRETRAALLPRPYARCLSRRPRHLRPTSSRYRQDEGRAQQARTTTSAQGR